MALMRQGCAESKSDGVTVGRSDKMGRAHVPPGVVLVAAGRIRLRFSPVWLGQSSVQPGCSYCVRLMLGRSS